MKPSRLIRSLETLNLLSDPRRLSVLRLLMRAPMTLSQVGRLQGLHPARIRHHLKLLEEAGLVELVSTRELRGFVEKYYAASAGAYFLQAAILPDTGDRDTLFAIGSHDPALELLAEHLQGKKNQPRLLAVPVGSLDGLVALRQGFCQLSGAHLYDPLDGEYNVSYVRRLFPGQPMRIVTLAHREQGLLVAPGNPQAIRGLGDVARETITFINRRRGSGTRLWLDHHLEAEGIPGVGIRGYEREVSTHAQVARAVASGEADAGLAVLAAARAHNLDFVPLFRERYDLVIPEAEYKSPRLAPVLEYVQTGAFRKTLLSLGGYDPAQTGVEIPV